MKSKSLSFFWIVTILYITVCIVFPLVCVALSVTPGDLKAVFSTDVWLTAMGNTALECVCSSTLSVLVGYIFAYAVVKGDIPFSKIFRAVPIIHLVTPPFVGGLSFILLVGRQGFITKTLLGLDVSLYGFWGLLISQVLCFFPIAYMICAETLRGMNPNYEQAALGMGASRLRIFLTITFPLSLPGILSALLFIAVSVLSDFGNPMIVAGRFRVLAVEIYTQLTGWMNAGISASIGLVLVVPSVLLFLAQNSLVKKTAKKTATIGGKSQFLPSKKSSLPTRIFLTAFCIAVSLAVLLQFIAIIFGAFQKLWGIDTSFTLKHIQSVFNYSTELKNSVFFAFLGALISTFFACLSAFIVSRTDLKLKRCIDIFAQIPAAVPGSLFGLAFSLAANSVGFKNSAALIVIAISVGFLPFSYRIMTSVLSQIKTTLDDGATSLGAGKIRGLFTVLLPISSGGIFSSFLYDFVRGVGTMSAVIFLVSFKTPLTSIKILNLAEEGFWGKAASLALFLTVITFSVIGGGKIFAKLISGMRKREK